MKRVNCTGKKSCYRMIIGKGGFALLFKIIMVICFLTHLGAKAQVSTDEEKPETKTVYDEIPVHVMVEGYTNFYVNALYSNKNQLFLNVLDLFKTLNIPCNYGEKGNTLDGFIENEKQKYYIDYPDRTIKIGTKTMTSENGLVKELGTLYMESSLFTEAFGITLSFNYRSFTVILKSNFELPVIKQNRIEKQRNNMSKVKGLETVDTILQRNYHLFKFGMVDWAASSSQTLKGPTDNHLGLGVGTELLFGEADVYVNYFSQQKFDNRQLYYIWRWVDNDKSFIKQAQVGKISTQTISFINAPIIGGVIRNTPTTVRKAKGYHTINEYTEPNWSVELYINNVLVDFVKADATGLYVFKVPNVYGYTTLKLKFYGPLGEERTEERTINVPYTVMPENELEYELSAGIVQDSTSSRFGKGAINYGVNRFLTIGGGVEYLSSITNGKYIPYLSATFQPVSKLTISSEYAHGVKISGLMDYYFWKDALLEVDYTRYKDGQQATRFNAQEERKVKISMPFRIRMFNGFAKLDYAQLLYKDFSFNMANLMFSAYYNQFSVNPSAQFNWVGNKSSYITYNLALSYRLFNGITLRPSVQYDATNKSFISSKIAVDKNIHNGNVSVSYERNGMAKDNIINLNFRYDLTFARTNIFTSHSKDIANISESAQGSLAFGSGNKYIHVSNNPSVGKGGIALFPFLDINQNGIWDKGEQMIKINSVRILGGHIINCDKDSIIRITDLNPFTNYMLELKDNDLGNIVWRFKFKKYQIMVDPNQFKRIYMPIIPVGEVNGMTYMDIENKIKGIGRISVKIYRKKNMKLVAETLSESDGYISYLGLEPGDYIAKVDSMQLRTLDFIVKPTQKEFSIKVSKDGDIVGGVDFIMRTELKKAPLLDIQNIAQSVKMPALIEKIWIERDTMAYIPGDSLYKVQVLALRKKITVKNYFTKLLFDVPGLEIEEVLGEDELYHYSTGAFRIMADARKFLQVIKDSGWMDCFVAVYIGGQRAEPLFRLKVKEIKETNKF